MTARRAELPAGTVTLVLTDIEGSTRLVRELGEAYARALGDHRDIMRDAFRAHGGVEVDTQGDAFLYAFPEAGNALRATAAAQRGLAAHPWAGGHAVRVRMGVHTGRPTRTDEGYVGMDLHEAARIMAAAHGDQVLVSRATVESVGAGAIAGLSLDDLGEHRLKDLALPARLYQLTGEGLRDEFPPPRSLEGHFTNLPAPGSRLVGRDADLAEVRGLLDDGRRLITLTGPGGTGKTRLALQVAADALPGFPGGVFLADLSHVVNPELVAGTVAGALGLREGGGRSAEEALAAFLGERRLLLVLDNMEQVLEAAGLVGRLLRACHELVVVATSRAPLRLELETEWAVPPLQDAAAVALLAERAAQMGLPAPEGSVAARSAAVSTACRWRSSSRPRACARCPPTASSSGSSGACRSSRRARATRPHASARCGRRSPGATTCSGTPNAPSSRGAGRSGAASRSRPQRTSARPRSTSSRP